MTELEKELIAALEEIVRIRDEESTGTQNLVVSLVARKALDKAKSQAKAP